MKSQIATPEEKSTTESVGSPVLHEMKRKFSQILDDESSDGSDNETLRTKLERLAMENSTDDSDFNVSNIKRLIFKKFKIECNCVSVRIFLSEAEVRHQRIVIEENVECENFFKKILRFDDFSRLPIVRWSQAQGAARTTWTRRYHLTRRPRSRGKLANS